MTGSAVAQGAPASRKQFLSRGALVFGTIALTFTTLGCGPSSKEDAEANKYCQDKVSSNAGAGQYGLDGTSAEFKRGVGESFKECYQQRMSDYRNGYLKKPN